MGKNSSFGCSKIGEPATDPERLDKGKKAWMEPSRKGGPGKEASINLSAIYTYGKGT